MPQLLSIFSIVYPDHVYYLNRYLFVSRRDAHKFSGVGGRAALFVWIPCHLLQPGQKFYFNIRETFTETSTIKYLILSGLKEVPAGVAMIDHIIIY